MKKMHLLFPVFLAGLLAAGCSQQDSLNPAEEEAPSLKSATLNGKYIVVLKTNDAISKADLPIRKAKVKAEALGLIKKYEVQGEVEEVYQTALQGFTVNMAPGQAKKMALDGTVSFVEADQMITLSPVKVEARPGGGGSAGQTTSWGVTRVGGGDTYSGTGVAWIIDTGVDLTHPDLNVDLERGASFVPRVTSPNDDNGHGSHVAGIIAARNNTIGVIGVAPGAKVVPVKVLDKRGSGAYSTVIAGVDYVAGVAQPGDVANMSLGGPVSDALDQAVSKASAHVKFVLAAGNESDNAKNHSPARVDGSAIYTISAMGQNDLWASYSNFGNPPVDFCAPGSSIYSTYKGGGYATLSGTSMASPHVAGILLLGAVHADGTVKNDPDGNPDPIAHK